MSEKDQEYKELFAAEALEACEELNKLFSDLEKDHQNSVAVDAIFRITHTLKGNAMGMGFEEIAEISHLMEDIFSAIKNGKIQLGSSLFGSLFKANDTLGELVAALKTGERVKYKGIRTSLQVFLRKALSNEPAASSSDKQEQAKHPQQEAGRRGGDIEDAETPSEGDSVEKKDVVGESVLQESSEKGSETETESKSSENEHGVSKDDENEEDEDEESENQPKIVFSDLVQVPVRKLDAMLNLVGELIIERDRLIALNNDNGRRGSDYARLHRITSDLQYGVMDIRLVQIGFMFNKFHRIVRDVAALEKKKVNLELEGTNNEIDRNILKIMSDSLIHLVRNAVSHGIESAETRKKNGKKPEGTITLKARNEKDTVYIDVIDDGAGIDVQKIKKKAIEKGILLEELAGALNEEDIMMCIFAPGFSSAEKVTEVSGRGVGMDVVKRATESIGGRVSVSSVLGQGTTVTLALPSSMAVKGALLFEMAQQEFAIPLSYTEAVISLTKKDIHKVSSGLVSTYLDKSISIVFLKDLFKLSSLRSFSINGTLQETFNSLESDRKLDVLVVSNANKYVGFVVDKLLQQKEIVEKALSPPLDNIDLVSGVTILGNGNVCLVLDVMTIIDSLFKDAMLKTKTAMLN